MDLCYGEADGRGPKRSTQGRFFRLENNVFIQTYTHKNAHRAGFSLEGRLASESLPAGR